MNTCIPLRVIGYSTPQYLYQEKRQKMRIDGHTDNAVGQTFHVKNKSLLSSAMWTAIDFLTWDTKFPLTEYLQKKGWDTIQEKLDGIKTEPCWGKGIDIETDLNGKTMMEFFDEYAFLLKLKGFPLDCDNLFYYLAMVFHNDEMYREKMGWAVEWFGHFAFLNPVHTGITSKVCNIRPDLIPAWFIYDRPSVWRDEDYLSIFKRIHDEWDKYDMRENRKTHIKGMYDVFCRLFERNEAFREATKEMLLWFRNKQWMHEQWFEPEYWYPRTRGGIHYGVHGGVL
jgi:hypothetical protein